MNVRSSLWSGPRGGAAFTSACLTLLAGVDGPIWPWQTRGDELLVEAFPAAQLKHWHLPYRRYNGAGNAADEIRNQILSGVRERFPGFCAATYAQVLAAEADALDALLCAFAAIAVDRALLACVPDGQSPNEGWIAVHC